MAQDIVLKEGELVGFTPHSEYEFIVDVIKGCTEYHLNDISIQYDREGT